MIGLRAMLPADEDTGLASLSTPLAEIQRRLAAGDADVLRAVKRAGGYLGVLLHNLAAAYDPACIVLGGLCVDLGEPFVQTALQTLNDYAAAANLLPPIVQTSRFGADAVAVGAAALARFRLTRPMAAPNFVGAVAA